MWEGRRTGLLRMGNAVRCVVVRIQAVHHIWLRIGYVQVMNYLQSFLPLFTAIFNWVGDPVKYGPQLGLLPHVVHHFDPSMAGVARPRVHPSVPACLVSTECCLLFGVLLFAAPKHINSKPSGKL